VNRQIAESQIKFHMDKVQILKRNLDMRKTHGEKKLWELENQNQSALEAIQRQINGHEEKIKELQVILTT